MRISHTIKQDCVHRLQSDLDALQDHCMRMEVVLGHIPITEQLRRVCANLRKHITELENLDA